MTNEQRQEIVRKRAAARGSANATSDQTTRPPATITVAQTTQQGEHTQTGTARQASGNPVQNHLQNMMANASNWQSAAANNPSSDELTVNGSTYRRVNRTFFIRNAGDENERGSLTDGGANGGMLGADARVLETDPIAKVDVSGVGPTDIPELPIQQAAGLTDAIGEGPIILIMSQYAGYGKGRTIHSKGQLQHYGALVDDTSRKNGGGQCIITSEGYIIPLHIRNGLPYFDMRPPTDHELETLPHVFLTSDSPWDPSVLDEEYFDSAPTIKDETLEEVTLRRDNRDYRVDDCGDVRHSEAYDIVYSEALDVFYEAPETAATNGELTWNGIYDPVNDSMMSTLPNGSEVPMTSVERAAHSMSAMPHRIRRSKPDLDVLKPYFGWASNDRIKTMLEKTTQFYRAAVHYPFRRHFKSRFPAANVPRLTEWVATDTFFSDTAAHDDGVPGHGGCKMIQLYTGMTSEFIRIFPMKSEEQVAETLEELIRKVGAPKGLKSDNAKSEMSRKVKDIQRMYCIDDMQSEPGYQHQNYAERRIQDLKRMMNNVMDRVGCDAKYWLLCAIFVAMLMNVLPNSKGEIPESCITGQLTDVSRFSHFHFWQEVFVDSNDKDHPGEKLARWCYPADNVGDELTYWVLLNETQQLVARSNVRPANDPMFPNRRLRPDPFLRHLTYRQGRNQTEGPSLRTYKTNSTLQSRCQSSRRKT